MKRLAVLISIIALALLCFGCASNEASNGSSQSNDAQSSVASNANEATTEDLVGIMGPVAEPPIACTKKLDFQNVTLMIPEDWEAQVGMGEYLKISYGKEIFGSMDVQESDLNANNSDEELLVFVNSTKEQQINNGFILDENFTVTRKGELGYILIPFKATQDTQEGKSQDFWGYSFCGYDNELITANLSCTKDDKDVLATFRWILENMEVS